VVGTLAAGVATALGGCAASETATAPEPTYIASLSTERRANPRVVDLLVELVEDHGATRLVVVTESGNSVFQTQLRPEQRFVRVPLEDGVDAILHPIATVESLDHELVLYDGETELARRPWQPTIDLDYDRDSTVEPLDPGRCLSHLTQSQRRRFTHSATTEACESGFAS